MEEFYREAMKRCRPNKVVTDFYGSEVNSKSSFSSSPPYFNIKFIFSRETDISFHFLNTSCNYKRQHVSKAELPKKEVFADFNEFTAEGTKHRVIAEKLEILIVPPDLRRKMAEIALSAADACLKSKPSDHNSVVIASCARVSLRFDFEENTMPLFDEEGWCRIFREYIVVSTAAAEYSSETCCSICLDDFSDQLVSVYAPCGHKFHRDCINEWLARSKSVKRRLCPNCRKDIKKDRLML
ncbi:hypothetical protein ACP275_14G056400 [Erythranthe tilingii]